MLNSVIGFKVNCIKFTAYAGITGGEFTVHLDFFFVNNIWISVFGQAVT